MTLDAQAFKDGMRRLASGVTIITTAQDGLRQGLTASAVCSLSAAPPLLLACVNRTASAHDVIAQTRTFCVNVLAAQHLSLARLFADHKAVARRFDEGDWGVAETGAPVLADAIASFDCRLDTALEKATHTVYIGAVVAARHNPSAAPLLYFDGHFSGLGVALG